MEDYIQAATKDLLKDIDENLKGDLDELKKSANKFLIKIESSTLIWKALNANIEQQNLSIKDIYEAMRVSTETTQDFVSAQYEFEKAINNFFGRTIGLIWIDEETGDLLCGDEATAKQIYEVSTKKSEGRAAGSTSKVKELTQSFENFIKSLGGRGAKIKEHQLKFTATYWEVLDRWDWNRDPDNPWSRKSITVTKTKNGKKEKSENFIYRDTFYWKGGDGAIKGDPISGYSHSKKMNRGNIGEAYISILLNNDENVKSISPYSVSEDSVRQYWLYMKNHKLLNNVAGVVQGDVILAGNEAIQFAVKEGSFNTAAIGPYILTALQVMDIQNMPETSTPEEKVKNIFKNLKTLNKTIDEKLDEHAQKYADEVIKTIQK